MGQQQLLLIVLGTMIVGVAVAVGINMFTTGAINSERDALMNDVGNVGALAASYWRKPKALGGGARSFAGVTNIASFGLDSTNINGAYAMSSVTTNKFTLTATGTNEGAIVVATITQQGLTGSPVVTMP